MNCPGCGFNNPEGMKFCGECGTKLSAICPSCSFDNPPGMKFCGECGTKIDSTGEQPPKKEAPSDDGRLEKLQSFIPREMSEKILRTREEIEGERRNVTVLFTDVSGFTSMSEKLDPEEVYGIMNDCFKELVEIIYKYEGVVDKFIGDAIMALFGAPLAHEDDPERAIRAALEMQARLHELSKDLEKRLGFPIDMRVGINSGEVVAGSVGSDLKMDYTVMGDTVNLASRLESAAKIGSVLISDNTYSFVQHAFEVKQLDPVTVKGKSEPVNVYEVIGLKKVREEHRGSKATTALIGRTQEIELLNAKVDEAIAGKGSVAALVGDAGLGKSRLADELKAYAYNKGLSVLDGRCLSYQTSISYAIFQDLLSRYFSFSPQDPDETIFQKMESRTVENGKLRKCLPFFAFLFSIQNDATAMLKQLNAEQVKTQTISSIKKLVVTVAQKKPVVVILDNLQWTDSMSSEVIDLLAESVEDKRILLLLVSRPPLQAQKTDLVSRIESLGSKVFSKLDLPPLKDSNVRSLFKSLMNSKELPQRIADAVLARAEGNPLYIEELFRVMVDEEVLRPENGGWSFDESFSMVDAKISPTIQGLMMSRVDRLPEDDKKVLQCASVIGKNFTVPVLSSILTGEQNHLDRKLQSLEKNGFIETASDGSVEPEYSFKHILIQETVYHSLLMKRRLTLHSLVAEAIEAIYPQKINEMVELLAYHYTQSENKDKAIKYSVKAGYKAAGAFANHEAIDYFNRALKLLEDHGHPERERLALEGLGQIMFVIGDYEESVAKYEAALSLVGDEKESGLLKATILEKIGKSISYMGKFSEAIDVLEKGLNIIHFTGGGEIEKARTLSTIGWVRYNLGEYQEALQSCLEASLILEKTEYLRDLASTQNTTGTIYYDLGNWNEAIEYYGKSLKLVEKIGDLAGISACHANIGLILCDQNKIEESLSHHKKSLSIEQKMGNAYGIALSLNNMGMAHLSSGEWAKATRFFKRALETYKKTGAKDFLPEIILYLAEIEVYNANFKKAQMYSEEALAIARDLNSKLYEARAYRIYGTIGRYSRDFDNAEKYLIKSLELFRSLEMDLEIGRTLLQRAILLRRRAESGGTNVNELVSAALKDLDEIKSLFEKLGIERDLKIADEERKELETLRQ